MKVEFFRWPASLASGRIRGSIIQRELAQIGVELGRHIVVASKHGWPEEWVSGAEKVVFDVCDDHFEGPNRAHYLKWCRKADAVTCNTLGMRDVIRWHARREATVIPDTYEQPERPAKIADRLLWFGHLSNLEQLQRVLPALEGHPLHIVTNAETRGVLTQWTPESMDAAFEAAGLVIIPTGLKQGKSANRAVEAIRRGLFVVAEPLPAYSELGIWIGDIGQGVDWALSHQDEVLARIKRAQAYVRDEFSPRRIAGQWLRLFESL